MLQIAIVDDDYGCVSKVHGFVDRFFQSEAGGYQVTEFRDGADLVENYSGVFDLIFLDVQMDHTDGLSAAKKIRETDNDAVIIFISQMAQYAVEGYAVDALDFLVKPVDYYSFELKMRKAVNYIRDHRPQKIMVNSNGDYVMLSSESILYVEVFDHDLIYHTTGAVYRTSGTISQAKQQLGERHFKQCNRYCLVNMRYVTSVQGNELIVGGETVQISKRRRKEVLDALMRYFGGRA